MRFYNNDQNLDRMKQFLSSPDKRITLVVSPSGCGKSSFCQMCFASFPEFTVVRPFYELFHSHKEFVEHIERHINHKKKLLLFFDDVDVLFINNKSAQAYVSHLILNINKHNLDIKIIMTCTKHEEKKILDIRKKIDIIYLNAPTRKQCIEYITDNKLAPHAPRQRIEHFIDIFGCNLQSIQSNIRFYDIHNDSDSICLGMNIYEVCHHLLTKNQALSENAKSVYLSIDPTLITYTLYDNHRNFYEQNYEIPLHQLMQAYAFISNIYVYTSILETYFSNFLLKSISFDHNLLRLNGIQYAHRFLVQHKKVDTKKQQPYKVNYTTINSRSSQHFNNLKKLQKFASTYNFSRDNAFLTCELLHQKKNHTPRLFPEQINIAHCYISNICTSDIDPYIKTFTII